ncbi:NAD-dependent epimerase/dehydratase family protein [Pseudomonadota bacterium]
MRVLITGGAGYVGTELSYELESNADVEEVIIYDNLSRGSFNFFLGRSKFHKKTTFIHGDLLDTRKLKRALVGVDIVCHLAAKVTTPFADQDPHLFEQINHWGTAELVYAVEESDVKRFIYLSSASVYGASLQVVSVESPTAPITFYSISKKRGEEHVNRLFGSEIETYIIRCGNVYGYSKSMRFNSVINRFVFQAHFKNLITIDGDGEQNRSFIHIDKTANILAAVIDGELEQGTYDLVEDTLSVNFIANTLREIYPGLELLYVNQRLNLHQLKVKADPRINSLTSIEVRSLKQVLTKFKEQFTF